MPSKYQMQSGGLPAGTYNCRFTAVEDYEDAKNLAKYGPAVELVFRVLEGEHADENFSVICSPKLSPKSKLTKYAVAMNGGPISVGQEFDFADHFGAEGILVVEEIDGAGKPSSFIRTDRKK